MLVPLQGNRQFLCQLKQAVPLPETLWRGQARTSKKESGSLEVRRRCRWAERSKSLAYIMAGVSAIPFLLKQRVTRCSPGLPRLISSWSCA
jgi:hypothetical protein